MTIHSRSGFASCCNFVSCFLWVALHRNEPTRMARTTAWEDIRVLSTPSRRSRPHLSFSNCLRKQAGFPFHFASRFLGSEFLRQSHEKTSWTINVTPDFCNLSKKSIGCIERSCFLPESCQPERPTGSVGRLFREKVRGARPSFASLEHHESSLWSYVGPQGHFLFHVGDPSQVGEVGGVVDLTSAP